MGYTTSKTDWAVTDSPVDALKSNNRIEENIRALKESAIDIDGEKSFSDGFAADSILPDAESQIIFDGYTIDEYKTFTTGTLGNITLSAASFNTRHQTTNTDLTQIFSQAKTGSGNFYSHYAYGDSGGFGRITTDPLSRIRVRVYGPSRAGFGSYQRLTIFIPSMPTFKFLEVTIDGRSLPSNAIVTQYYYLSSTASSYTYFGYTLDELASFTSGIDVFVKRAKYPITAGQPVKVLDSDFSKTTTRAITDSDITNNRLTS